MHGEAVPEERSSIGRSSNSSSSGSSNKKHSATTHSPTQLQRKGLPTQATHSRRQEDEWGEEERGARTHNFLGNQHSDTVGAHTGVCCVCRSTETTNGGSFAENEKKRTTRLVLLVGRSAFVRLRLFSRVLASASSSIVIKQQTNTAPKTAETRASASVRERAAAKLFRQHFLGTVSPGVYGSFLR